MKLTLVNIGDQDQLDMANSRTDGKGKEVVFFDWKPSNIKSGYLNNQVEQMMRCRDEQIPVIVFDRYLSMTNEEIIFLHKKTNALLLEPSVVTRPGFQFMPYWIHFKEYKCSDFENERRFQTGYKGNMFTKDLEYNILSAIRDKLTVGLDVKLDQDKYDVLKSVVIIDKFEYEDLSTMILTGTQDEYDKGVLPDIRWIMDSGTIPCLYHKHKWLHSIFKHFVVNDHNDIAWLAKLYKTCNIGFVEEMQKNILDYLPEMEASNFINSILEKAHKL